jgi:hydrogenase maturation factor HypF (carbamoyltransferase family)
MSSDRDHADQGCHGGLSIWDSIEHLAEKTVKSAKEQGVSKVILAGGVAANSSLRQEIASSSNIHPSSRGSLNQGQELRHRSYVARRA